MAYPNALKSLSAKVQGPSYTVKKEMGIKKGSGVERPKAPSTVVHC